MSRIEAFIKRKEEAIRSIKSDIKFTSEPLQSATQAIENLELVIPLAREHMKAHVESLKALKAIEDRMIAARLQDLTGARLSEEAQSRKVCGRIIETTSASVSRFHPVVSQQIKQVTKEIREMQLGINELEEELDGWRFSLRLSELETSHLAEVKIQLESQLKTAKSAFGPIHRLPNEVWAEIFRYRVQGDLESYLTTPTYKSLPLTAFNLAHVCKRWRRVVTCRDAVDCRKSRPSRQSRHPTNPVESIDLLDSCLKRQLTAPRVNASECQYCPPASTSYRNVDSH
jgi:hypothetical protein